MLPLRGDVDRDVNRMRLRSCRNWNKPDKMAAT
jgi:hypothetical protein